MTDSGPLFDSRKTTASRSVVTPAWVDAATFANVNAVVLLVYGPSVASVSTTVVQSLDRRSNCTV
jgi:hypothetical protein